VHECVAGCALAGGSIGVGAFETIECLFVSVKVRYIFQILFLFSCESTSIIFPFIESCDLSY
jgi:hypothetical protein